jgi:AmmeMemoRadiSam system protein A
MYEPGPNLNRLTPGEKRFLRQVADRSVAAGARGRPPIDPLPLALREDIDLEPRLLEHRGAFVTLKSDGMLRGCIGYVEGLKPLVLAVADNGRNAAVNDPRFPPVTAAELPLVTIEISALTPLVAVNGYEEIVIGRHGVHLAREGHQAVFLPQVAVEQGWNLRETLTQLALKAGLRHDAWRAHCDFRVFEAEVF